MANETSHPDTIPLDGAGRLARALRVRAASGLCFTERRLLLFVLDLLVISGALFLALWARSTLLHEMEPVGFFPLRPIWWVMLAAVWTPLALVFDCYNLKLASEPWRGVAYVMGCALLASLVYLVIPEHAAPLSRSRLAWFLFAFAAVAGEGLWRFAYARISRQVPFSRRILIVGAGAAGKALAREIARLGEYAGVQLVGFVDDKAGLRGQHIAGNYRVLGDSHDLATLVRQLAVVDIVVAITHTQTICPDLMRALIVCWTSGTSVFTMPVYYEQVTGAIPVEHLGPSLFSLVGAQDSLGLRLWLVFRRLADIAVGVLGLAITGLLLPLIAPAIVIESPGPVFYRQERVGRGGQRFWMTKFRSMIPNAEKQGAVWATKGDARRTRVGAFLRRTRLDELPQFWNILNGTMTLIGPRPERPEFVAQLTACLPHFPIRHAVTPGLTGWAQVRFHYAASMDDSLQKLCYDLYYIKWRGPALDSLIFLYTLRVLLRMEGS